MLISRRRALTALAMMCSAGEARRLFGAQNQPGVPRDRLVGTVPLGRFDGRAGPPIGLRLGAGLDARQLNDLSTLTPSTMVTPTDRFYVRTGATPANTRPAPWTLNLGGRVRRPGELPLETFEPLIEDRGIHLMECSGNADPANFGLLSAARWTGVPLGAVLDRAEPTAEASFVKATGVDDEVGVSVTSTPGASWIFPRADLERAGAFLATGMNDGPLPPDHGYPVRLIVPNWYGCVCIKWLSGLELLAEDGPPTSQMREFAARTHQRGMPALVSAFEPAVIDLAAMPVRVEHWASEGRSWYRVIGIIWGGAKLTDALTIRFKSNQPFVPVSHPSRRESLTTWSLWSHDWEPETPGRYQIVLKLNDPDVRTRRLDLFYYTREVQIEDV